MKEIPKEKSLAAMRPDLAKEWHPTLNGALKPTDVTAGSNKKVWWFLPYDDPKTGKHFDFEWEAVVSDRNKGSGCPYLSGKAVWVGYNDLATANQELAKEWHPTKNGNLTPYNVSPCSYKKVWWYLPYDDPKTGKHFDFEWQAIISNRVLGCGCPFLSGQAVWIGFNDLKTTNPKLAAEWHPTKNGDLTPYDVTSGSQKKVWWYLPYDDPKTGKHFNFEWQATIKSRAKGTGCPILAGLMVWPGFNDLETTHPELAKEWHPTKNGTLTPRDVTYGTKKKVWWMKKYDGEWREWRAAISHRALQGTEYAGSTVSKLEKAISKMLSENGLCVELEFIFNGFVSPKGRSYRYDFYLNKMKLLIECDGSQHFRETNDYFYVPGEFEYRCECDNIKNKYAMANNIPLLRIPHIYSAPKKQKELEEIILEFIETKKVPQKILDFYAQFEFSNYVECVNKFQNKLGKTAA